MVDAVAYLDYPFISNGTVFDLLALPPAFLTLDTVGGEMRKQLSSQSQCSLMPQPSTPQGLRRAVVTKQSRLLKITHTYQGLR